MSISGNFFVPSHTKRKRKMMINKDIIDSVKYVDVIDFDHEECEMIQGFHKTLLNHAMHHNNSNEVGMLVELCNDWSYIIVKGTEEVVLMKADDTAKELLETSPKNSLLFFHNHPKNSWFSEKDLDSFLSSDAIKMMSVVCNNGRLFFLVKLKNFNKEAALIMHDNIYNKVEDEESSVYEFLRTCKSVHLKFIYGGENND